MPPFLIFDTESHFHPSSVELLPVISVLVYIFSLSCFFSSLSHYIVKIFLVKEHKIQQRQNSNTDKNSFFFCCCFSVSNNTPFLCSLILVFYCGSSSIYSIFSQSDKSSPVVGCKQFTIKFSFLIQI